MNPKNIVLFLAVLAIFLLPEPPSVLPLHASTTEESETLREGSEHGECLESTYLRRVFLDLTGYLPTLEEQQSFLTSKSPTKKTDLVNRLLQSNNHSEKWGRWLAFQLGADETELVYAASELGCSQFHLTSAWIAWAQNHTAMDTPYPSIVKELLGAVSRGNEGRVQYHSWLERFRARAKVDGFSAAKDYSSRKPLDLYWRGYSRIYDPMSRGEDIAKRFLGKSLECARCHDHPSDTWTQQDYQQFSAIFSPIKYAELPLTSAEKRVTLLIFPSVAALGVVVLLTSMRFTSRRFARLGFQAILSFGFGVIVIVSVAYIHIFSSTFPRASLAQRLDSIFTDTTSRGFLVATIICLLGLGFWIIIYFRKITKHYGVGRHCKLLVAVFAFGALLINGVDWWHVYHRRIQGSSVQPVFYEWHRNALRICGLGGCGQQPREVFVSDEKFTDSVPARLLGEDVFVPEDSTLIPRFLYWLTEEKVDEFAECIVDRLLSEYFPRLMNSSDVSNAESEDFHEITFLTNLRERLLRVFRQQEGSLRSLHCEIVRSQLYCLPSVGSISQHSNGSPDHHFPPRRLTAEQFLGSLERIVDCRLFVDQQYGPNGGSLFDVGARYPWGADFASRVFRIFPKKPEDQEFTLESSMLLMVDSSWASALSDQSSWVFSDEFRMLSADSQIDYLFRVALVRSPTGAEKDFARHEWLKAKDNDDAVLALLCNLVSTTEFHYVY